MSFIRIKTIKGNKYAYLVENSWKRKTSKQKVKQYLGRVYSLNKKQPYNFLVFAGIDNIVMYINNTAHENILTDLIIYEIYFHGFKKIDNLKWEHNGIIIDLENKYIKQNNKDIVLQLNDGFLCSHTMNKLFSFNQKGNTKKVAVNLARLFVDAGLNIPKDVYVEFFQKINKGKSDVLN